MQFNHDQIVIPKSNRNAKKYFDISYTNIEIQAKP